MSASVTEAATAKNELDPSSGKISLEAAEGKRMMKAGRWNTVCRNVEPTSIAAYHILRNNKR